jgi:glycosyltransferase involved in cell wall biosynthesis
VNGTHPTYAVIIPIYRNEAFITDLVGEMVRLRDALTGKAVVEVVFVDDGSPDNSYALLKHALSQGHLRSRLVRHSRNFGSLAAIKTGLTVSDADFYAVYSGDMQEPPRLLFDFLEHLMSRTADIVVGRRSSREDPWLQSILSKLFWRVYRSTVMPEIPVGGVDAFACSRRVRNELLNLKELNSSLIAQLFWLGFPRAEVAYMRKKREHGASSWTWGKRTRYFLDSFFSFTDLPINALWLISLFGIGISLLSVINVLIGKLVSQWQIPGYSTTVTLIVFFGSLNLIGISVVGTYAWRAFENTKNRPFGLISSVESFIPPEEPSLLTGEDA